ncbi:MAG: amidohydrolase family protein [Methanocorpusculum sp.]|nr:amidohydrolase family protein [Methanocorpusculum sp.]MDE2521916.1 amidohydrolase family protein [Methanocorpusculum sp.]MDE2525458.1 amidohydrolase family protein [Methanocorpusculum sp.]
MQDGELQGLAFCGETFSPRNVTISIEKGIITEIAESTKPPAGWIAPAFFNAHTHIADTVAMDTPVQGRPLADLVAPPNGLKHRILRATQDERLSAAMHETMQFMHTTGTAAFAEFREGGAHGVQLLQQADTPGIHPVIFGRDGGEFVADGLGLSSAKHPAADLAAVERARAAGKRIAIHAGEAGTKDIEDAFALDPDFIIHATCFEERHIREAADRNIPLVICPRSNWILGGTDAASRPPVRKMIDAGCTLWLGTDNVMFVAPDMFAECAFLTTVYKTSPEETLSMATGGFSLLGHRGIIEEGEPANLICLDPGYAKEWTQSPALSLVSRIGSRSVRVMYG